MRLGAVLPIEFKDTPPPTSVIADGAPSSDEASFLLPQERALVVEFRNHTSRYRAHVQGSFRRSGVRGAGSQPGAR